MCCIALRVHTRLPEMPKLVCDQAANRYIVQNAVSNDKKVRGEPWPPQYKAHMRSVTITTGYTKYCSTYSTHLHYINEKHLEVHNPCVYYDLKINILYN